MRSWTRAAAAALGLALGLGALAADDKKDADKDKPAKPVTDAEFVIIAASSGVYEVEAGKLAKDRASGAEVKKFAEKMVEDHTKANKELAEVAKKADLGVPTQLMEADTKHLEALRARTGTDFDREYVAQQVKAHDEAVALFESASKNAKNAALKDFAAKTLPTLKEHQKHAKMLAKGEAGKDK